MRLRPVLAFFLNAPCILWIVLALPAVLMTYGYWQGTIFYGEYLHSTGELAAQLLIAAMAITPLSLVLANGAWVRWLALRRRNLGVAAFGYSLLHAVAYIERQAAYAPIIEDALETAMWTGWLALIVMSALAATSNHASVRILRYGWKRLHRFVYAIAVLTFAHWILSAFDRTSALVHLGVLASLESYRIWKAIGDPTAARPAAKAERR